MFSKFLLLSALVVMTAAFGIHAQSQCPAGQRAVQGEKPLTANGCGVPGLHISMDGSEYFERPCCDLHDVSYSLCGLSFDEAENHFEKCMKKYCGRAPSDKQMTCNSASSTFAMTRMMGAGHFKKMQEEYCQCVDEDDQETIANAYMPHVERVYREALSDDEEVEDKLDNFRNKVLAKYFKSKNEYKPLWDLYQKYPASIPLVKDEAKKSDL